MLNIIGKQNNRVIKNVFIIFLGIIGVYYVVINVGFDDDTKVKFFEKFQTEEFRPNVSSPKQQTELETRPPRKNIFKNISLK